MNGYPFSSQQPIRVLMALITIFSTSFWGMKGMDSASQQALAAALTIEVPASVELGDRIEIQLIVQNIHDLAGYEGQLLFDTSAAHFSGLHQRNSDLKKFGRDVMPLEVEEMPDGIAMGLASCPYPDCVEMKGSPQPNGANGKVRLATILIGTDQPGRLELSFEHLEFVDSSGNPLVVDIPQSKIYVQVGPDNGINFPAPASRWQWSPSAPSEGHFDVTGDGLVNYADAAEVALEWTLGREQNQPCGSANDLSRDVNGDGCIDIVDIQLILANTVVTRSSTTQPGNSNQTQSTTQSPTVAASPLTFIVNSTADTDDSNIGDGICASSAGCTLRAAINEADYHYGPDTILFNIPGSGVHTIQLSSRLPSIWDGSGGTTIDGYSQPGAQPNTDSLVSNAHIMIEIRGNGAGAFDGMLIQSAGNRIQGLAIYNVRRAIWIYGSGARSNSIVGDFLGTNAAGTFILSTWAAFAAGVLMDVGPAGNHIGGTAPADRNVISGNARHGMEINSEGTDNNEIFNNIIGLNPAGNQRLQNMRHGIDVNAGPSNNLFGGTGSGQRNILSGNGEVGNPDYPAGIEISHDTLTDKNQVIGNCIGTDPTCTTGPAWALNSHYGIRIEDGVNENVIAGNIIGNNLKGGIKLDATNTDLNQIYNNRIGVSLNNTAIPNGGFGIQIASWSKSNKVGPNNIIANNPVGVEIIGYNTDNNTVTQNSIFNNDRLGIDLGTIIGVTPNDSGDGDSNENQELNMPVLNSATTTSVSGTACAETVVSKPCTIEVFIAERKPSDSGGGNYGQGKTFVGSGATSANGSFVVSVSGVTVGQYLTATATDADGNTSEFSQNIQVSGGGGSSAYASDPFSRTIVDGWGSADIGGNYTLSGTAANFDVDGTAGTITMPSVNISRSAILRSVSALDVNVTFSLKTDKLAAGSHYSAYFIARSISSNTEYVGSIRLTPSGAVYLRAVRFVNGTSTSLGTEVLVSGLTYAANSYIKVRGQVVGTNPTTIRLKAWADGQPEPANWQYTVTDSTSNLQAAGAVGLRTFLPSAVTNAPLIFTFDDFVVTAP